MSQQDIFLLIMFLIFMDMFSVYSSIQHTIFIDDITPPLHPLFEEMTFLGIYVWKMSKNLMQCN
jgi:hypothetical protein